MKTDAELQHAALPMAPDDVRDRIAAVLERRAERAASHLDLDLQDGTVTLTGPVHSLPERRAILAAARFTPGVRRVVDHLYFDLNT